MGQGTVNALRNGQKTSRQRTHLSQQQHTAAESASMSSCVPTGNVRLRYIYTSESMCCRFERRTLFVACEAVCPAVLLHQAEHCAFGASCPVFLRAAASSDLLSSQMSRRCLIRASSDVDGRDQRGRGPATAQLQFDRLPPGRQRVLR